MHVMRISAPGAEKPAVPVDDTHSIDVSDLTPDFDERLFAAEGAASPAEPIPGTRRQHVAGALAGAR
ncbi:hypothetical protein ACWEPN_31945 [Nonomuraea wenchangensis]